MFCAQCGQWAAEQQAACERCGATLGGTAIGPLPGAGSAMHGAGEHARAVKFAGFWRRFGVMLADSLVLFFPFAILRLVLDPDSAGRGADFEDPAYWTVFSLNVLLWGLYCTLLESSPAQGTLGQQLLGVRVCDGQLRRISFARACGRFLAQWLSICLCGTGYLVNLWTKRRQALHDLVAGCVHVRSESSAAPAAVRTEGA
jgi:uncharacterized RDD family membrane protein YckC